MKIFIKPVTFCLFLGLVFTSFATGQETFFVSPTGDDSADGSEASPWGTMGFACVQLAAGDTLIVEDGDYFEENTIQVRFRDPETGDQLPLLGDPNHHSTIRSRNRNSRIHGDFDVRGSFLTIAGLEVIGDGNGENRPAGIGVYESMEIGLYDNVVHNHDGCGILIFQCDLVDIAGNVAFDNARTNSAQHSGISIFQPIVRTLEGGVATDAPISEQISNRFGITIRYNVCFNNETFVPSAAGIVTDGNGIIVDDYDYTQANDTLSSAVAGFGGPFGFAGTPMIDTDEDGGLVTYARRTLISDNVLYHNGGRGIHSFLATKVIIKRNICSANLRSVALQEALFRNENGELNFLNGEISLFESDDCKVVKNFAISFFPEKAAASEAFFNFAPEDGVSTNLWRRNLFINAADPNDSISVFGAESTLQPTAP